MHVLISQEIVEWYMAIRKAKLNLLGYNESEMSPEKVKNILLTRHSMAKLKPGMCMVVLTMYSCSTSLFKGGVNYIIIITGFC